ncbi:hypothetical protein SteCoe_30217 [Stentor coeruleus]|uniref:Uncharacterized protein n=1 Tax=Stentor coeruleus TaxID=5963 RepID=A0A1R2B431_9CILI|nr:hypothetical protein SteCoe_30217 [Stentor coeruleus]
MERNCIFNIPETLGKDIKVRTYKSPDSSPNGKALLSARKSTTGLFEIDFGYRKKKKHRNSVDLTTFDLQKDCFFKSMELQKEKVKQMQKLLTSTQQPHNDDHLESQIKEKILENRVLAESIKNLSLNYSFTERDSTESILIKASTIEIEILSIQKSLKNYLSIHNLKFKKQELENMQNLCINNKMLKKQINELKLKHEKYHKNPHEIHEMKKKYETLNEKYSTCLNENSELQEQLIQIKKKNLNRVNCIKKDNTIELACILTDVSKLAYVAKAYCEKNLIDFSVLMQNNNICKCNSPQEYLENIKKQLERLRVSCTDVYAEQCGSTCNTQ